MHTKNKNQITNKHRIPMNIECGKSIKYGKATSYLFLNEIINKQKRQNKDQDQRRNPYMRGSRGGGKWGPAIAIGFVVMLV